MAIEISELALGIRVSWTDSAGQEHFGVIEGYRVAGKVEGSFPHESDGPNSKGRDMVYVSFDKPTTTIAATLFLDGSVTICD